MLWIPPPPLDPTEVNHAGAGQTLCYLSPAVTFSMEGRCPKPKRKQAPSCGQYPVPPKLFQSLSRHLLLPLHMPGDSLSQEGIYFCIIA